MFAPLPTVSRTPTRPASVPGVPALLRTAIALALSAVALPALAANEDAPVFVTVDLEGTGWSGENCEGGEWSLGWSGPVAVEPGPLADLLISYTAFDTTQPNQVGIAPAKFDAKPVRCRDNHGNVVLRADVAGSGSSDVQVTVSLAEDAGVGSPSVIFTGNDLGICHVQSEAMSMEQPVMVSLDTRSMARISPALEITLEDLQNGFDKSYRFEGSVIGAAPMCMGHELKRGTLRMRYKSGEDDPTVSLDACLHLAKGETRSITAAGSPAGGAYRFSTFGGTFAVRSSGGSTADVTGQTPGKGDVRVEYERRGRTASAAVAGSVVDVISVNGGAAIPPFGLYGADGMKLSGTRDFPLKLDPVDGTVTMTLADDTLASVVNTSSRVQVQPVKIGRTLMQAKTLCGSPVGPKVPLEIVRCTDEVKAQLRNQQQAMKSQIDQLVKRITSLTANEEFNEAATEIGNSTRDLAIKTGETIIGTLTFGESKHIEFAGKRGIALSKEVLVNSKRMEVVGTVWDIGDMLNDAGEATDSPSDWQKVAKPVVSAAVMLAQNEAIALGKTYGEAYLAAEKFGRHLGTLVGVAEQLEQLEPQLDRLVKEYVRISTRLEYCEKAPPPPVPAPPKPEPPKPGPKDPVPVPVDEESPTEIPVPQEPTPEDPIPPPPPEPGKKVYGLACRVQDLRAPGVNQRLQALRQYVLAQRTSPSGAPATGSSPAAPSAPGSRSDAAALDAFTTVTIDTALTRADELQTLRGLGQDLSELKRIAAAHVSQLDGARTALQQWQGAIATMKTAIDAGDEPARAAFPAFVQARDRFLLDAGQRGYSSLEVMMETDECRDRLEVKIDQVRTRYN